jgi:hypothetical protein
MSQTKNEKQPVAIHLKFYNVPPSSSLEKEVLSNHQQPVAANIHKFPLIRR